MMRVKEMVGRGAAVLFLVLIATAANAQTVIISVSGKALGNIAGD
jgi:hypothetical protein